MSDFTFPCATRRRMRAAPIITALFASLTVLPAQAQQAEGPDHYPSRTAKIVVGFGAGGGTDAVARIVAQKLQDLMGGSFLVENKPGRADGLHRTLSPSPRPMATRCWARAGAMTIGTAIWKNYPYNIMKDFIPISLMSESPMVVVVNKDHPARTMAELIAWLKANPDKANYPTPSPVFTLPIEHFKLKTGAPATPIPYRSSNEP